MLHINLQSVKAYSILLLAAFSERMSQVAITAPALFIGPHRSLPHCRLEPWQTLAEASQSAYAENALLRVPLIMLKRQVKRPACTKADRILLVLRARVVQAWKQVLVIVQPETRLAMAS